MTWSDKINNMNQVISRRIPNWVRLLFPLILGGLLIALIIYIFYFGGKRESLIARGESAMIRWALSNATEEANPKKSKVVTISVTDDDAPFIRLAPSEQLLDAHISEYASVLETIAATNPEWIVVSWLTYAHPVTPEYLKPLTDVIDRLNIHKKTTLAVNLYASGTIPPEFMTTYNIVEARDCYYDVNLFCTVSPDWTWMPQQVMNRYFRDPGDRIVSLNLPHVLPNILLNLPDPNSIQRHSFLDFRPPAMSDIASGSIIFIGNNTRQPLHFRNNKDAIQKTYVASSSDDTSLMQDGIPWHNFWAAMTSMFIESKMIAVAPAWVDWTIVTLTTIAAVICLRVMGSLAIAPFFAISLLLPFINIPLVSWFQLYIPVMPVVVTGITIFMATTFISVAFSSYKKWRLIAAEELADSTTDIKQNFIHLISHNLNTPVAQLRGLLDILASQSTSDRGIARASVLIEYIRLTVRAVLNTTTMANQAPRISEHSIRQMAREFLENEGSFFRRTGTELLVTPPQDDDTLGEIWFYTFNFDRQMVELSILYAAAFVALRSGASGINLDFSPVNDEPADPKGLIVTVSARFATAQSHDFETAFPVNALRQFLEMIAHRGFMSLAETDSSMTMTFPVRS